MSQAVASKPESASMPKVSKEQRRPGIPFLPFAWLVVGAALFALTNGRLIVPLAAWLAPIFLLRFMRSQRVLVGLVCIEITLATLACWMWRGMVPLPGVVLYALAIAALTQTFVVPFLLDRLIAPKLSGWYATLVFPAAWVTAEYATAALSPFASWGAVAYTQFGSLSLLQITSITGMWGVAFLIAWFASVANLVWEEGLARRQVRWSVAAYTALFVASLLYGGLRLALFAPSGETVRIASITASEKIRVQVRSETPDLEVDASEADRQAFRAGVAALHDYLLERSRLEAQAGAKLVFWPEGHAAVLKENEAELIDRGRQLCREEGIYLGLGMVVLHTESPMMTFENKLVIIDPAGETVADYFKQRPVPGPETQLSVISVRDDKVALVDTPFGRVAGAICYDMDFPLFIRQAGEAEADIFIAPSNDWQEIDPIHTHMAAMRGIELGCSVIRHTSNGLSLAVDHQGRVLAAMDHFTAPENERVMVANVPVSGVRTIYARVGDAFAWICIAGLVCAGAWAAIGPRAEATG